MKKIIVGTRVNKTLKAIKIMQEYQPRPQGLLAFQNGGGSGEDPGTQQNHMTKISNEDGNIFKMAAKAK